MTITRSTTSSTRKVPSFELTLTILGAVCSAVVTGALAAENVSTTGKLIGMAVGAALPPLVGAVGPGHPVRVAVAVMLTALAVVIGYGGLQIFATVSDTEPPLPTPQEIVTGLNGGSAQAGDSHGTDGDEHSEVALVERRGNLGIKVVPGSITCRAEDGCGPVTVTSVGTAPLNITSLEFEGDAGAYLTAEGCDRAVLGPQEQCSIMLTFVSESAPESATTHLVIHQNLPRVPTLVPLEAHGVLPPEPNLALGQADCDRSQLVLDPGTGDVSGVLTVRAPIVPAGSPALPAVEAAVFVNGALQWTSPVNLSAGEVAFSDGYDGPPPDDVVVTIDSAQQLDEANEDDNATVCPAP